MGLLDSLLKYASPAKKNRVLQYDMAINQARACVNIRDMQGQTNTTVQHLKLTFGNYALPLDNVFSGCKFLVVPTNEVAMVREKLQNAVNQGEFDKEIVVLQEIRKNKAETQGAQHV
tara:strand:- start:632 stop:982 length:351 start_codon:yes stop_codon:yes gene_type:complete